MERVAAALLVALSSVAHAQRAVTFADCPVKLEAAHKTPRLVFDAKSRQYRSEITNAAGGPPNFAGHYILAQWGCGAGCVMAAAIDTKTGHVSSLPFTVSDWPLNVTEPLNFHVNSCLLVVQGSRNESKQHGTYYYAFDGKSFRLQASDAR